MRHYTLLTCCCLMASITVPTHASRADEVSYVDAMNTVSLDVQGDNADTRAASVSGSVGFGQYFWVEGGVGKLRNTGDEATTLGDLKHGDIGFGAQGKNLLFRVSASRYRNDAAYRQRDINTTVEWHNELLAFGVDGMHRRTENSLDTTRNFPLLNLTDVAIHAEETLTGRGLGAHIDWNATSALTLSFGGMHYHYDSDYTLESSTNPLLIRALLNRFPTLEETFYLNQSGITRDLALLDSSYHLGLSYQWNNASASTYYIRDKALDGGDQTDTVQLSASFFLGDHTMLSPTIGHSSSDNAEDVNFAGLSVSYHW